jgi:hypothetical protein
MRSHQRSARRRRSCAPHRSCRTRGPRRTIVRCNCVTLGGLGNLRDMALAPTPLIARMRPRLFRSVWALAFVILAKGILASLCLVDGFSGSGGASTASAVVSSEVGANHADDDAAPCWHAGIGGCHCTCVHATPLPVVAWMWFAAPLSSRPVVWLAQPPHSLFLPPSLRPPIA